MLKRLIVLAAVALLALPAAALGSNSSTPANASCKAQLKAIGATAFYAPGMYTSFGACVSKAQHLTPAQRQNLLAAEKTCRAWQLADAAGFQAKYGTNATTGKHSTTPTSGSKSNAFGKCVSSLNHA
jgi:hypothetical protein